MSYEILQVPDYSSVENLEVLKRLSETNPPKDILRVLSPDDFEEFIEEWAYYTLQKGQKNRYAKVYKLGGTGDKGRDILGFYKENLEVLDVYQCKHYSSALSPADVKKEVVKVCYYTYTKEFHWPENYFFIAANDLTASAEKLLRNPQELKETVLKEWDGIVHQVIKDKSKKVSLTASLKTCINKADFSIFKFKPILKIIDEYLRTPLAPYRFGKNHLKPRPTPQGPPEDIETGEVEYTKQLFEVYQVQNEEELKGKHKRHFKSQRAHFFEAESLKVYEQEVSLPGKDDFNVIKMRVLAHIIDVYDFKKFDSILEKVIDITKTARNAKLAKENYLIADYVEDNDKHGICHHLVNDKEIFWYKEEEI